ncbi:MAG TPA: choice-of-anchor P family protein [Jatrophihabitantaceae bacterium]|jgi:hypothetical protein|nr:choice-of-anchor P family protein [Jatrophihabitantaceae bacterium]
MRNRLPLALIAITAGLATSVVGVTSANATTPLPEAIGYSGATMVTAANGAVISNLTSTSGLDATTGGQAAGNSLASAAVAGLLTTGAVSSSQASTAVTGGIQMTSKANVADVSLLGGLITVGAVNTTASAKIVNGVVSANSATTLANIKIVGVTLPLNVPVNFGVTIPGVASVVLNAVDTVSDGPGSIRTDAAGIYVSLLKSVGSSPVGTEVYLTPSHAEIEPGVALTTTPVGGFAFGTQISAAAGTVASVSSGPTAYNLLGQGGTGGKDVTNSTVGINIPLVATSGVVSTVSNGTSTPALSSAKMSVSVAGLSLFGGLITASALTGVAQASQPAGKPIALSESTTLVNLVIAGVKIPVNVAPNTAIQLAGVGTVTVNAQSHTANAAGVCLLEIKLSTAGFGLPVGAEVQVGAAAAYVGAL